MGQKTFTVTASDHARNTASVSRHYTVANARPDARIRRGMGVLVGNNVYTTTGVNESRSGKAHAGQSVTYRVRSRTTPPSWSRSGCGVTLDQPVHGPVPQSGQHQHHLTGGCRHLSDPVLAAGATRTIRVVVTVHRSVPRNASLARTVTVTSDTHPTIKDTVRFVTTRA